MDRRKKRLFGPGDESAVLIIVLHTSSVLVTVHQKKKKAKKLIQTGKSLWPFSRNSGVFCRIPLIFTGIGGRNKKTPVCNHFGRHGISFTFAKSHTLVVLPVRRNACNLALGGKHCRGGTLPLVARSFRLTRMRPPDHRNTISSPHETCFRIKCRWRSSWAVTDGHQHEVSCFSYSQVWPLPHCSLLRSATMGTHSWSWILVLRLTVITLVASKVRMAPR